MSQSRRFRIEVVVMYLCSFMWAHVQLLNFSSQIAVYAYLHLKKSIKLADILCQWQAYIFIWLFSKKTFHVYFLCRVTI